MFEGVPVVGVLRAGYFLVKNIYRRVFPRTPIEIATVLRGHVEIGHDVLLVNTSDEPILVYSIDIVTAEKQGDSDNCERVFDLEDQMLNIRLDKRESYMFNFSEGDHFPMRPDKGKYYMRVWLAGRRGPIWLSL